MFVEDARLVNSALVIIDRPRSLVEVGRVCSFCVQARKNCFFLFEGGPGMFPGLRSAGCA